VNRVRPTYLGARYVLDRVFATVLLVVISPLLAVIAVLVWVTSGRPVLFLQDRVGRHGEVFSILKFRTMVADAEHIGGGYTPEGANLVTPIGRLLRASSLDELPQLVNIVRGEMALIGPRPSLVDQYRRYTTFQLRRTEVLPGITGLAQVTYRDDAPWSKRIELDVDYIDRAGPALDAAILLRTIRRVVSGARSDQTPGEVDDLG
jgi:lipopolysaccharide/colanic/teichoic acid biosynthesis glycosyltransferase